MNKHVKCILKALFAIPVLAFALVLTTLQLIFIVIPLGILKMSGCTNKELPDAYADFILIWYHDL